MSANIIQESDPLGDSKSVFLVIGVRQVYSKLDVRSLFNICACDFEF
jgi:hypothetical protein